LLPIIDVKITIDSFIIFLTFKQKTTALSFDFKHKKSEPNGSLFSIFRLVS